MDFKKINFEGKTAAERRELDDIRRAKIAQKKYEREKIRHDNKIVKTVHLKYDIENDWYIMEINTGVRQDHVSEYAVHVTGKNNTYFTHNLRGLEYPSGQTAIELCNWIEGAKKFDKAMLFKPSLSNQIDIKKIGIIALIGIVALFVLSGGI